MPSPYIVRNFHDNAICHLYNAGLKNKDIFLEESDYKMFFYYLYIYVANPFEIEKKYPNLPKRLKINNYNQVIEILSYCLMPNHFHLLVKQKEKHVIPQFMKQLTNAYTQYFQTKYRKRGPLFRGRYKAIEIPTIEEAAYVSRFIHLNPLLEGLTSSIKNDKWSSYADYMTKKKKTFTSKETLLSLFRSPKLYEKFVLDKSDFTHQLYKQKKLFIDYKYEASLERYSTPKSSFR